MASKIHHFSVQIYYEDTDHSGVVYHPNFLKYFERAREHVLGADILAKLWNEDGLGFAVFRADCRFLDGVEFADICDIRTSVEIDGDYRTIWTQEVWRPNATKAAVIGSIEMVCMGKDKKLKKIPDFIRGGIF